jgi:hypothetical protein
MIWEDTDIVHPASQHRQIRSRATRVATYRSVGYGLGWLEPYCPAMRTTGVEKDRFGHGRWVNGETRRKNGHCLFTSASTNAKPLLAHVRLPHSGLQRRNCFLFYLLLIIIIQAFNNCGWVHANRQVSRLVVHSIRICQYMHWYLCIFVLGGLGN